MTTPTPALRSAIAGAIHDRNNPAHVGLPVADAVWRQYLGDADAALLALTPFLAPAPVEQARGEQWAHKTPKWAFGAMEEICELQDGRQTEALHINVENARWMIAGIIAKHAHFQSLATEKGGEDTDLEWLFERGEVTLGRSEDGNVMLSWRDKAYYGDTVEEAANAAMREGAK